MSKISRLPTQLAAQQKLPVSESFEDAAERLAWISDMQFVRESLNRISARVLDSFIDVSTIDTLKIAYYLEDARKAVETACLYVNRSK